MSASPELAGVIPITATPFDDRERIDEASVASRVAFEARCGVHGPGNFPGVRLSQETWALVRRSWSALGSARARAGP